MNNNRLTKQIFLWDKNKNIRNWSSEILKILTDIGLEEKFYLCEDVDLNYSKNVLFSADKEHWCQQVVTVPKLRTYVTYKNLYKVEPYVYKVMNRGHRSIIAQFRTGILPLAIETGRYNDIPLQYRLCNFCSEDVIEDECHFLFECNLYHEERQLFLTEIQNKDSQFALKSTYEKLEALMNEDLVKLTAKFLYGCYNKRRHVLYNHIINTVPYNSTTDVVKCDL